MCSTTSVGRSVRSVAGSMLRDLARDETEAPVDVNMAGGLAGPSAPLRGGRLVQRVQVGTTLLNGTLGPGSLVLPMVFQRTGLLTGSALLCFVWLVSYLALLMLREATVVTRTQSLVELASLHGPRMSLLVDLSVVLYFYGTCISYLVMMLFTFQHVLDLSRAAADAPWASPWAQAHAAELLLVGVTAVLLLPLSCARSLGALGRVSPLTVGGWIYIFGVIWLCEGDRSGAAAPAPPAGLPSLAVMLRSLSTMAYCIHGAAVYPPALEALRSKEEAADGTEAVARRLTDATWAATLLLYLGIGTGGVLRCPGTASANALDGYEPTAAVIGAFLFLAFALSTSFPVMFLVARMHVYSLCRGFLKVPDKSLRSVTAVLVVVAVATAIVLPSVELFLGLMGCTCSVTLAFVVPALLYRRFVMGQERHGARSAVLQPWALVAFAALVAAVSLPAQILQAVGGATAKHAGAPALTAPSAHSHLDDSSVLALKPEAWVRAAPLILEVGGRHHDAAAAGAAGAAAPTGAAAPAAAAAAGGGRAEPPPKHQQSSAGRIFPDASVIWVDRAAIPSLVANHTDGNTLPMVDVVIDEGPYKGIHGPRRWSEQQQVLVGLWPLLRPGGHFFIEHVERGALGSNETGSAALALLREGRASFAQPDAFQRWPPARVLVYLTKPLRSRAAGFRRVELSSFVSDAPPELEATIAADAARASATAAAATVPDTGGGAKRGGGRGGGRGGKGKGKGKGRRREADPFHHVGESGPWKTPSKTLLSAIS